MTVQEIELALGLIRKYLKLCKASLGNAIALIPLDLLKSVDCVEKFAEITADENEKKRYREKYFCMVERFSLKNNNLLNHQVNLYYLFISFSAENRILLSIASRSKFLAVRLQKIVQRCLDFNEKCLSCDFARKIDPQILNTYNSFLEKWDFEDLCASEIEFAINIIKIHLKICKKNVRINSSSFEKEPQDLEIWTLPLLSLNPNSDLNDVRKVL